MPKTVVTNKTLYKKSTSGKTMKAIGTKTVTKKPWLMSGDQRHDLQLARINQSTAKSAISEFGKTARSTAATLAGTKAYQTAASTRIAEKAAGVNSQSAIDLYNRIMSGNPDQKGETGDESTTTVGGSGSKIGG